MLIITAVITLETEIKIIRIKYIHCIKQQVLIAIKGLHIAINFNKPKPEIRWSSSWKHFVHLWMLNKSQTHVVNFVVLYNPFGHKWHVTVYLTSNTQLKQNFNCNITSHISYRDKYCKYYNLYFDKNIFIEFRHPYLMNMEFSFKNNTSVTEVWKFSIRFYCRKAKLKCFVTAMCSILQTICIF